MRETCSSFQQPVVYNLLNGVEHAQHKQHLPQSRGASVQVWAGIIINTAIHFTSFKYFNTSDLKNMAIKAETPPLLYRRVT